MFPGKPLVFQTYCHNENKSNVELFNVLYFSASLCVPSGQVSQVIGMSTPENPGTVLSLCLGALFRSSVMTSSFLHFISIDMGLVVPKLAKSFFSGYFFLPATLKLPVITGLSDDQNL